MRTVGFIAVVVVAIGVVAAVITGVASIPDIKRYLKIRAM
jgi:hypothetical protein